MNKLLVGTGIVLLILAAYGYAQPSVTTPCNKNQVYFVDSGKCVDIVRNESTNCGVWDRILGKCQAHGMVGADCGTVTPGTNDACCKAKNPNSVWSQEAFRCVNEQALGQENCGFWARITGKCTTTTTLPGASTTTLQCQQNQVWSAEVGRCVGTSAYNQQGCGFWARLLGRC